MDALQEKIMTTWSSLKAAAVTLAHAVIAVGALVLVIHSWILLSNGKQREALGAVLSAVMGAGGALVFVEEWLAAALAAVHALGAVWGRAERAQCAKQAAAHAALAGLWYALLRWGGPIVTGFGIPAAGSEEKLLWAAFYILLVTGALRVPGRLSIAWQAATTARAAPGELPPIGGVKL
ncbi:MAG: hypothetical protein HY077_08465 [Elusimicrobia bacterium]|nr:hypothetical protein [Elusimicrobiota bacterium]